MAAVGFTVFVLFSMVVAHVLALRREGAGAFWAQILDRLALVAIPILLISTFSSYPQLQERLPRTATQWLLIVGTLWLLLLAVGIVRPPDSASGRWIAGILGFSPHRFWVLLFAIPFVPSLFFLAPPWLTDNVYAALWAVVVLFFAALIGLSFSASPIAGWTGTQSMPQKQTVVLFPWREDMRRRGVHLTPIGDWEPALSPPAVAGMAAEWQQRLAIAGSSGVSGTLCEAVSKLMDATPDLQQRVSIVLAPDQCGQEEVVALTATELARRFGETTLIVTAWTDASLAKRISHWLDAVGGENPVRLVNLSDSARPATQADVLMVDAETLSDAILGQLRAELEVEDGAGAQALRLGRIGLVVWWNAHEFSGVDAAHVWAVSRRLERLLGTRRGAPARALVLARRPKDQEAAFLGFIAHLLPYEQFPGKNVFQIPADYAKHAHLYRLADSSATAIRTATEASLATEWKTYGPPDLQLAAAQSPAPSSALAGARILDLRPDEVLSLREIICQGGRAENGQPDHHVAVAASDNPYINYLLDHYRDHGQQAASINLVGAEGHKELVQRHLLLSLREVPDTLTGLRSNFRWEEQTLRRALDNLSREDRLRRSPVRFLDREGRLQRDSLYANKNPGQGAVRSFRIIGGRDQPPVELRDTDQRDRLLLQLDPERLPLDAYPMRVFQAAGRSYRVQGWPAIPPGGKAGNVPARISCKLEETGVRNWPFSTMRVANVRSNGDRSTTPGVVSYTAKVQYYEDVSGVWERAGNGDFSFIGINPVRTNFETEALMLDFTEAVPLNLMVCAAAALQYIVPVHMAVEGNALRVVALTDPDRARLALVDLYPGGIGVVTAMHRFPWLMPKLFDQVALWLASLKTTADMEEVARSPIFRTRSIQRLDAEKVRRVFTSAGMRQG